MGQGTHSTKMGAGSSAENTPNASKSFCPKCLPKPKSLMFSEKKALWVSIVHGWDFFRQLTASQPFWCYVDWTILYLQQNILLWKCIL